MGHRGKERVVTCEKCGRSVRKDKAVFIEKPIFTNPLERKDIAQGQPYTRMITREVAYCPGCGKHLRVYEKKKRQNERDREREQEHKRYSRFRERSPHRAPRAQQSETQGAQQGETQGAQQSGQESAQQG